MAEAEERNLRPEFDRRRPAVPCFVGVTLSPWRSASYPRAAENLLHFYFISDSVLKRNRASEDVVGHARHGSILAAATGMERR